MICSLNLDLNKRYYNEDQQNKLISILENVKYISDKDGTMHSITGFIENFKITITETRIYLNGSLTKFYHGNNVVTLTKEEMSPAIKRLKQVTGLPVQYAVIRRIDLAINIFLEQPYYIYLPYFEDSYGYIKGINQYKGITYRKENRNTTSEFVIYNKLAEVCSQSPDVYNVVKVVMNEHNEKGIMRLELRLKKSVSMQLLPNGKKLTLPYLLSSKVRQRLAQIWFKTYRSIDKKCKPILSDPKGYKEMKDALAAMQIKNMGKAKLMRSIDDIARRCRWSAKKKSITKTAFYELFRKSIKSILPPSYIELEQKILHGEELLKWLETRN